jgi:hypothetical protein
MPRTRGPAGLFLCALAILLLCGSSLVAARDSAAGDGPTESVPAPEQETNNSESHPDFSLRPTDENPDTLPDDVIRVDKPVLGDEMSADYGNDWSWHWVPEGLIYHSYMAGVHEPRMALFSFSDLRDGVYWDATLGGRVGLVRYGNNDPVCPEGYQLDFYGAAITRLDVLNQQDVNSADYVFGFPVTWGDEQWQWKCGYAHLSSHMGDEYAISHIGALNERINYVRDSLVLGTSYYVNPAWRLYGETGFAFHRSGGAGAFDAQFGTEISPPGPTGPNWIPYVAANGRVRSDEDFARDLTLQWGYLRRSILDRTLRLGAQFYTGNSSQFEFFNRTEHQLGLGVWYDY